MFVVFPLYCIYVCIVILTVTVLRPVLLTRTLLLADDVGVLCFKSRNCCFVTSGGGQLSTEGVIVTRLLTTASIATCAFTSRLKTVLNILFSSKRLERSASQK